MLGFLLLYTTKDEVRVYLAESIFSCNDDPENLPMVKYVQSWNTGVEHQQPVPIHQGTLLRSTGKDYWSSEKPQRC